MATATLLAVALLAAAPSGSPTVPEPAAAREIPIDVVIVDAASIDATLRGEITLRSAGREVIASDEVVRVPDSLFAWVGIEWIADAQPRLRIVVSDGRTYSRTVDAPVDQIPRAVAGALANMLAAIEQDAIAPEATGVAVPLPTPSTAAPPPTTEPTAAPPREPTPVRTPAQPPWRIGPRLSGMAMFGVGAPTDLDGYVGAGGGLGLDVAHARGALLTLALRGTTHARDGVRLVRLRVALAGGHLFHRGRFELASRVGLSIEPVIVRDRGRVPVTTAPLVGVLASVSPAFVWRASRSSAALRVGIDLEIAAAMEARARPGVVRLVDESGERPVPLLRAGGVELTAGASLGSWFALPHRAR